MWRLSILNHTRMFSNKFFKPASVNDNRFFVRINCLKILLKIFV